METIVELFRDNIAFKLIAGILMFLFSNLSNMTSEVYFKEIEKESIEITFDKKFLELNRIYNDHYLNY